MWHSMNVEARDNLWNSVLFPNLVGLVVQTQVVSLCTKHLYPLAISPAQRKLDFPRIVNPFSNLERIYNLFEVTNQTDLTVVH